MIVWAKASRPGTDGYQGPVRSSFARRAGSRASSLSTGQTHWQDCAVCPISPAAAAAAKLLQPCLTLCDPIDGRTTRLPHPWDSPGKNTGVGCHCLLHCVTVKVKSLSRIRLVATPWTAAYQAPPSMGFSRQEYRSGLPLPSLTKSD